MSNRLPRITASQIIHALERAGFMLARQSGGHIIYKNVEGRRATVPMHAGKILHPKVLQSILADADISPERLRELL